MTISFPSSPSTGDTYTYNNINYIFDGTRWSKDYVKYSYKGSIASNVNNIVNLDLSSANMFELNLSDIAEVNFTNPPTSAYRFYLKLKYNTDYEYDAGWNLAVASYTNNFTPVGTQDTSPIGLFFKPDGTKMYVVGYANDRVYEYNLSTAWSVSTAVYSGNSFYVGTEDTSPTGLFFKSDGTKMYVVGDSNDRVYEYNLSTAWSVSTAVYSGSSASVGSQDTSPRSIFFKPDGTKMYVVGLTNGRVYEYNLSTAWSVSTAVYSGNSFYVGTEDTSPTGLFFKSDGTKMYVVGDSNDRVYEYNLSTAWSVSTAVYSGSSASVGTQDTSPIGLFFKPDGTKMYVVGYANDRVYEYDTYSISNTPTITWPTNITWETGSAPTLPQLGQSDLLEFYTSNGGTTYYGRQAEDNLI